MEKFAREGLESWAATMRAHTGRGLVYKDRQATPETYYRAVGKEK